MEKDAIEKMIIELVKPRKGKRNGPQNNNNNNNNNKIIYIYTSHSRL
jgi:hypothetical protein